MEGVRQGLKSCDLRNKVYIAQILRTNKAGHETGGQKYQETPLHSPLRTAILKQTTLENAQLCAMRHGGLCNV